MLAVGLAVACAGCGGGAGSSTFGDPTASTLMAGLQAIVADARQRGDDEAAERMMAMVDDPMAGRPYTHTAADMAPTIRAGERVVAVAPRAGEPRRGDIVVLTPTDTAVQTCQPGATTAPMLIKRVVGLPGERVRIRAGSPDVVVDGVSYRPPGATRNPAARDLRVPPGSYVVLADRRGGACDSATWTDPFVPAGNIRWVVTGVYHPLQRARLIDRGKP